MRSPRMRFAVVFSVMLIAWQFSSFCPRLMAQTNTATVSGTIMDPQGKVVPGVGVAITNVDTGVVSATKTNGSGIYVLTALPPGHYRVVVTKQGFKQVALTDLVLNVQDSISRNFSLELGATSESVSVSAEGTHLDTTDASVSTVVDQQFVKNMPLNGRSFQSLIYMIPGVTIIPAPVINNNASGSFSVDGQRTDANYFSVDGVSANFGMYPAASPGQFAGGTAPGLTFGGGTNALVSVDDMQEFRIQTSSFAPEFGRTPGGQISIATKSGTNQWHGDAYDYLRNDLFDARNYFDAPPLTKTPLRQNDFGGTFGGPIWKDHTFFFFSYEGLRTRQPTIEDGYFLTQATLANLSGPWAPVLKTAPVPDPSAPLGDTSCDNVTVPCFGEIKAGVDASSSFDATSIRVDQKLTSKISVFARYDHAPSTGSSPNFQEMNNSTDNMDTLTAGMTWTLSPTMINDFRANWSRMKGVSGVSLDTFHGATVPAASLLYPPGYSPATSQALFYLCADAFAFCEEVRDGSQQASAQRQLNIVDTLSKSLGAHQLKFGVDFRRMQPGAQNINGASFFSFDWPSVQAGQAPTALISTGNPIIAHMNNWSVFGQDTWRATPRLTLTYGLRWDINTPPVSDTSGKPLYAVQGIFDSNPVALAPAGTPLWRTQRDAFAPRIGAAYEITPHTVVRGGFGLFYDLGYGGGVGYLMGGSFPYEVTKFVSGHPLDLNDPAFQPPPFTTTITPDVNGLPGVDPHLRLPVTYQWNVAFERQLGSSQTISATWVGAYGQNLLRMDTLQPPGPPGYGGLNVYATRNFDHSRYNSMQLQYMRRMSRGLQAMVGYTLAKAQDTHSNDVGGYIAASLSQIVHPPLTNSDLDIRNTLSAAVSYDLPSPAWGRLGHAIFGGWGLDTIFRASSGPPLDVTISATDPTTGLIYRTQPNLVPGQPIWIPDPTQPAGKALNPAAFTLPPFGTPGNFLRNSISSPYGMDQTDMAIRRTFNITERVKLVARAEYFNVFNHPMFGGFFGLDTNWGYCSGDTPNTCGPGFYFGKLYPGVTTLNVGLGGAGSGGQDVLYAPGGPRSGQISLKLIF